MANGKVVFPSGALAPTTYTFPKNYDYGHKTSYVESDDTQRAFSGKMYSYSGPLKKTYSLEFSFVSKAQMEYFTNLWFNNYELDLYLNGVDLDATVQIQTPPDSNSEAAWVDGEMVWSFTLELQEI
jgi:hypothetical protein